MGQGGSRRWLLTCGVLTGCGALIAVALAVGGGVLAGTGAGVLVYVLQAVPGVEAPEEGWIEVAPEPVVAEPDLAPSDGEADEEPPAGGAPEEAPASGTPASDGGVTEPAPPKPAPVAPAPAPAPVAPAPAVPTPAPVPAPAAPAPAPAAQPSTPAGGTDKPVATGRVELQGDGQVRLVAADGSVVTPPGEVPQGRYDIQVSFDGAASFSAGRLVILAGDTKRIVCRASLGKCRVQ